MPGFVLNPISDPDDIRREAAANTPNSPIAAQQARIEEIQADTAKADQPGGVATGQSQTLPDNDPAASASATAIAQNTPLEVSMASLQDNEPPQIVHEGTGAIEQPAQQTTEQAPILAFTSSNATGTPPTNMVAPKSFTPSSVYPNPTHEAKVADKLEGQATYSYSYKLPVGVYIIAALSIEIALFMWISIAFFDARSWQFIVQALIFSISAAGLLKGNDIVRWVTVAAAGAGVLYYGYYFVKVLSDYLKYSSQLYGVFGSFVTGTIILYGIGVLFLVVSGVYLTRPGVARAFR